MLEADAIQCVVEFDVDTEVVGIQFQLVSWLQAFFFVDVHAQRCYGTIDRHMPVCISVRMRFVSHRRFRPAGTVGGRSAID